MKRFKKLLSLLTAVIMCLSLVPSTAFAGSSIKGTTDAEKELKEFAIDFDPVTEDTAVDKITVTTAPDAPYTVFIHSIVNIHDLSEHVTELKLGNEYAIRFEIIPKTGYTIPTENVQNLKLTVNGKDTVNAVSFRPETCYPIFYYNFKVAREITEFAIDFGPVTEGTKADKITVTAASDAHYTASVESLEEVGSSEKVTELELNKEYVIEFKITPKTGYTIPYDNYRENLKLTVNGKDTIKAIGTELGTAYPVFSYRFKVTKEITEFAANIGPLTVGTKADAITVTAPKDAHYGFFKGSLKKTGSLEEVTELEMDEYILTIKAVPDKGYSIPSEKYQENLKLSVNGRTPIYAADYDMDKGIAIFKYKFAGSKEIKQFVADVGPLTAGTAVDTITAETNTSIYYTSIESVKEVGSPKPVTSLEAGKTYDIKVLIRPAIGYIIPSDNYKKNLSLVINGKDTVNATDYITATGCAVFNYRITLADAGSGSTLRNFIVTAGPLTAGTATKDIKITVPANSGYSARINNIEYGKVKNVKSLEAGKSYRMYIILKADTGYEISLDKLSELNLTVNSTVLKGADEYNPATHEVTFYYNFNVPSEVTNKEIKDININVKAPVTGKKPSAPSESSAEFSINKYRWIPADKTFKSNKVYKLEVLLDTAVGYDFGSSLNSVTINGKSAKITDLTGDKNGLRIVFEFPKTEPEFILPDIDLGTGGGHKLEESDNPVRMIKIEETKHGLILTDKEFATKGEIITISPVPDKGYEADEITVTDSDDDELKLTKDGRNYTFKMPSANVTVNITFKKAEAPKHSFSDVSTFAWYADAVSYVYENGLMAGTSSTTFAPDANTNRAMIVSILYRLEKAPKVNSANKFTDVAEGMWYTESVKWAAENNIVSGYGNGLFKPDAPITIEQLASILQRYAQYKGYDMKQADNLNMFAVNSVSDWAKDAVKWAVAHHIITSTGAGAAVPNTNAVRAQAAVMLMQFCENIIK